MAEGGLSMGDGRTGMVTGCLGAQRGGVVSDAGSGPRRGPAASLEAGGTVPDSETAGEMTAWPRID